MNNANCELRGLPEQPVTRQHGTQARTATLSPNDEAMRDFFRRGDRGQYEGGPADHSLHSLLKVEVPERAPIVRTPPCSDSLRSRVAGGLCGFFGRSGTFEFEWH